MRSSLSVGGAQVQPNSSKSKLKPIHVPVSPAAAVRRVDLDALQVFDAVMTERSMARAATRLAMTPSAVSHSIARLRRRFSDPLFTRAPGGVEPTPRAHDLWGQVAEALERLRAATASSTFTPATDPLAISVAMNDMLNLLLLPPLYAALSRQAPQVSLSVRHRDPAENEAALVKGMLDFAVSLEPATALHPSLRSSLLWRDRYALLFRRGHAFGQGCGPEALRRAFRISVSPDGRTPSLAERALVRQGASEASRLVVSTFSCVPALLLRTEAVAVMPSRYVAGLVAEDERLATAPLQMKLPELSYVLLWHERSDRKPSHRWARVAIEQIAREKMGG